MKRKSTLLLIAALVLAVSIPLFAFAETTTFGTQPQDGTGYMNGRAVTDEDLAALQATGFTFGNGYGVDEFGYCYALDADGTQQRLYARGANGETMALRLANGNFCWAADDDDAAPAIYQNRRMNTTTETTTFGGRGCGRWN